MYNISTNHACIAAHACRSAYIITLCIVTSYLKFYTFVLFFFSNIALSIGAIVGIVIAVLITVCIIPMVVAVVFCVCCAGATVCCTVGRHNNHAPAVNVNITTSTGADMPAPPPSYSQSAIQPTAAYIPYSGAPLQAAPQQQNQLYDKSPAGPPAVEMADVQVSVVT